MAKATNTRDQSTHSAALFEGLEPRLLLSTTVLSGALEGVYLDDIVVTAESADAWPPASITTSGATWLELNPAGDDTKTTTIMSSGEQDIYTFVPNSGGTAYFFVNTPSSSLDPREALYDSSGDLIPGQFDDNGGPGNDSDFSHNLSAFGTRYYLMVDGAGGTSTGVYDVVVDTQGSAYSSPALDGNGAWSGYVGIFWPGDQDYYKFTAPAGTTSLHLWTTDMTDTVDTVLNLYDYDSVSGFNELERNESGGSGGNATITRPITAGTTYYIRIAGSGTDTGDTTLHVHFTGDVADLFDDGDAWSHFNPSTVVSPGTPFDAFFDIGNTGPAASGSFDVDFYASANTTITTGDYFLGRVTMPSISAGGFATAHLGLSPTPGFPGGIPTGDYYVGIRIDPTDAVAESNESNNTGLNTDDYPLTVTDDETDLALTQLLVSPTTVTSVPTPGSSAFTSCSFTLTNNGPVDLVSEGVMVDYYLSPNTTFGDVDDIPIGDTAFTLSIGSGTSQAINLNSLELQNMTDLWDGTVPDGNYYVFARVRLTTPPPTDPTPGNDHAGTKSTILYTPGQPDLIGTNFDAIPDHPMPASGTTTVNFSVWNQGTAAAGAFSIAFYLSDNGTISASDTLVGIRPVTGVAAGGTYSSSITLSLPTPDPFQTDNEYWLGMIIDSTNAVTESDETNNSNEGELDDMDDISSEDHLIYPTGPASTTNVAPETLTLNTPRPGDIGGDEWIGAYDIDTYRFQPATSQPVDFNVTGGFYMQLYDSAWTQLGSGLSPVQYNVVAGETYYLAIRGAGSGASDPRMLVGRSTGSTGAYTVTATPTSPPDLFGSDCHLSSQVLNWGDSFTIDGQIENNGGAVSTDFWVDFGLSSNTTFGDADDIWPAGWYYHHTDDIGANSLGPDFTTSTFTLPATAPSGYTGTGLFYVGMKTDSLGYVTESDETNNGPGDIGLSFDYDSFKVPHEQPILNTSGASVDYTEDDGAVVLDAKVTVSDVDSSELVSGEVWLHTDYFAGEDELVFTDQNGITGSFSSTTGSLTLTGTASVANYQAALRSVRYRNDSQDPTGGGRIAKFVVNDGFSDSTGTNTTVSIHVTPVNDPPENIDLVGRSVDEKAPNGTIVGKFGATDPEGDPVTFALLDDAGGRFAIADGNKLVVADGSLLDYEVDPVHSIIVEASDGLLPTSRLFNDIVVNDLMLVSPAPTSVDLLPASDTGQLDTDDITMLDNSSGASTLDFSVSGTVAGATVTLYADGTPIGSAVAAGTTTTVTTNGAKDLADGPNAITAKQTESGELESGDSAPLNVIVDTEAPQVTQVFVAGTAWTAGFLAAVGDDRGWAVPDGVDQLKSLPWPNLDEFKIVLDEEVVVANDDLGVYGISTPEYAMDPAGFSYPDPDGPAGLTATWKLTAAVPLADKLLLVLSSDSVTDVAGNMLDGEWANGTDTYNSGDGAAGGDFAFRLNILPGDVNQSGGRVTALDWILTRARTNLRPGDVGYEPLYDNNGSGGMTALDWILVRVRTNTQLPAGEPTPTAPAGAASQGTDAQFQTYATLLGEQIAGGISAASPLAASTAKPQASAAPSGTSFATVGIVPAILVEPSSQAELEPVVTPALARLWPLLASSDPSAPSAEFEPSLDTDLADMLGEELDSTLPAL